MSINYDYFLLIAENLNISRAAKCAFISQQSMSTYLQNLEEALGVTLFERKPKLKLTPAGHIFYRYAIQSRDLTDNLYADLGSHAVQRETSLKIGISFGRALAYLPEVLPDFYACTPEPVFVSTAFMYTREMYEKILDNSIDIGVAVNPMEYPGIRQTVLYHEKLLLAVSDRTLRRYFPNNYADLKEASKAGADLNVFSAIPFIAYDRYNQCFKVLQSLLDSQEISLQYVASINSSEIQIPLLLRQNVAAVIPQSLIPNVRDLNRKTDKDNKINLFPIKGLLDGVTISVLVRESQNNNTLCNLFTESLRQYVNANIQSCDISTLY